MRYEAIDPAILLVVKEAVNVLVKRPERTAQYENSEMYAAKDRQEEKGHPAYPERRNQTVRLSHEIGLKSWYFAFPLHPGLDLAS